MPDFNHYPISTDWWIAETAHLTREERGLFHDMLIIAWRVSSCDLPNDPAWLCRRLGLTDHEFETQCRPILDEFWRLNKRQRFEQKKQKQERNYVSKKSAKNRTAARTRWNKTKTGHANAVPKPCTVHSPGIAPTLSPTPTPIKSSVEPNGSTGADAPLDLDAMLYREGRKILGKRNGALVTKLKRAKGGLEALKVLEEAQRKAEPVAYVAAACKTGKDDEAAIAKMVDDALEGWETSDVRSRWNS